MSKAKLTPQQRYHRLWRKVDQDYVSDGAAAPPVTFGTTIPGSHASTHFDGPTPRIEVGEGVTKMLGSRDPYKRRKARRVLLWEFGRTIQGDRPDSWVAGQTNSVSRRLNKDQDQRLKRKRQARAAVIEARLRK